MNLSESEMDGGSYPPVPIPAAPGQNVRGSAGRCQGPVAADPSRFACGRDHSAPRRTASTLTDTGAWLSMCTRSGSNRDSCSSAPAPTVGDMPRRIGPVDFDAAGHGEGFIRPQPTTTTGCAGSGDHRAAPAPAPGTCLRLREDRLTRRSDAHPHEAGRNNRQHGFGVPSYFHMFVLPSETPGGRPPPRYAKQTCWSGL